MAGTNAITTPTPNNAVLSPFNDIVNLIGNIGNTAAGVYTNFLSAQSTKAIADAQQLGAINAPQLANIRAQATKNTAVSLLAYAGLGLVVIGGVFLLAKKVK